MVPDFSERQAMLIRLQIEIRNTTDVTVSWADLDAIVSAYGRSPTIQKIINSFGPQNEEQNEPKTLPKRKR